MVGVVDLVAVVLDAEAVVSGVADLDEEVVALVVAAVLVVVALVVEVEDLVEADSEEEIAEALEVIYIIYQFICFKIHLTYNQSVQTNPNMRVYKFT